MALAASPAVLETHQRCLFMVVTTKTREEVSGKDSDAMAHPGGKVMPKK